MQALRAILPQRGGLAATTIPLKKALRFARKKSLNLKLNRRAESARAPLPAAPLPQLRFRWSQGRGWQATGTT
jgi:hypothetical protein